MTLAEDTVKLTKKPKDPAASRRRPDRRIKSSMTPTEGAIARRAYQLFVERGGGHGRDWEDWLLAERELRSSDR